MAGSGAALFCAPGLEEWERQGAAALRTTLGRKGQSGPRGTEAEGGRGVPGSESRGHPGEGCGSDLVCQETPKREPGLRAASVGQPSPQGFARASRGG